MQVGSLDHFHVFAHPNHPDRHHEHAADKTASLRGHGKVGAVFTKFACILQIFPDNAM